MVGFWFVSVLGVLGVVLYVCWVLMLFMCDIGLIVMFWSDDEFFDEDVFMCFRSFCVGLCCCVLVDVVLCGGVCFVVCYS